MQLQEVRQTAQMLIQRHGLRAQAVAEERAAEARQRGDNAAMDDWRQIHDMVCELKRTARAAMKEGAE